MWQRRVCFRRNIRSQTKYVDIINEYSRYVYHYLAKPQLKQETIPSMLDMQVHS